MKNKRVWFFVIWTFFTLLGIVLFHCTFGDPYFILWYFLGFRMPENVLYIMEFFAFFDYPIMCLFMALLFGVCVIFWIIALIRIKKSRMFEWLLVADRIGALLLWVILWITIKDDFVGWIYIAELAVENILMVGLIWLVKRKKWCPNL